MFNAKFVQSKGEARRLIDQNGISIDGDVVTDATMDGKLEISSVNAVAPGIIETDMISELPADEVKKVVPMRRFGKPEEVAGVVAFLFREEAAYITRQVISVNGGLC